MSIFSKNSRKLSHKERVLEALQDELRDFLRKKGVLAPLVALERPVDFAYGDMSTNIALKYAKELKKNPRALAEEIQMHLGNKIAGGSGKSGKSDTKLEGVDKIEIAGAGFINLFFDAEFWASTLEDILKQGDTYGKNDLLKGQKWVIEHTSPNPNKAMHLGHLRNNLVGMSLMKALEWNGATVVADAVDNNRGVAIAKVMWGFLIHMKKDGQDNINKEVLAPADLEIRVQAWVARPAEWLTPKEAGLLPDVFVTECYIKGEEDFKKHEAVENATRDLVVKWEAKDKNVRKLWKHVLGYAYEGMERTLARLGNRWDRVWHEHEHYEDGKEYVEYGLKKSVFKKLEDGAVLTDLAAYKIPDTILLKRDGTSLYITQDIALTELKKKKYHADKLVWVIGPEQSLAMKQLFAVCEQLGIGKLSDFAHVSYGYVGLKDETGAFKKMSSREGTVVLIDDVIDVAKAKIATQLEADSKNSEEKMKLAEKMALAAVKFSILKPDRSQDLTFDVDRSIETKGDSGVYVLYTYVRTQSILEKALKQGAKIKVEKTAIGGKVGKNVSQNVVPKILMFFPDILKRSREELSVHHVAQYLLDVCAAFNSWYAQEVILNDSDDQAHKLAIVEATAHVIKNGLSVLGIQTVDKI